MPSKNSQPQTSVSRTRALMGYSGTIWHVALFTLPLDLLLPSLPPFRLYGDGTFEIIRLIALALLALSLGLSFRSQLLKYASELQNFRRRFRSLIKDKPWLLPVSLAIFGLLEGVAKFGFDLLGLVAALIGIAIYLLLQLRKKDAGIAKQFEEGPATLERLRESEMFIFIIVIAPIITARVGGFLGALAYAGASTGVNGILPFVATAALLLFANHPGIDDFYTTCPSCLAKSPRAGIDLRVCLVCGSELKFRERDLEIKSFLKQSRVSMARDVAQISPTDKTLPTKKLGNALKKISLRPAWPKRNNSPKNN